MLLPDATRQFAPVSARSRTDAFHVTTIASDANNGFVVTYVVEGEERTVRFEAADYGTPEYQYDYYTETEDGGKFWLNSRYGSFTDDEKNQGSPDFQYLDIYGSGVQTAGTQNRQHLTFGARTDAANLPVGTATYAGSFNAENHPAEYANLDTRSFLWGEWRLTADFSASTLGGEIGLVRVRGPGESAFRYLPYTTAFRIENGHIVDGQFTASVSGVDSDPNAPEDRTLRGFEGDMLGEFYGPGAEEAGGVLSAARAIGQPGACRLVRRQAGAGVRHQRARGRPVRLVSGGRQGLGRVDGRADRHRRGDGHRERRRERIPCDVPGGRRRAAGSCP